MRDVGGKVGGGRGGERVRGIGIIGIREGRMRRGGNSEEWWEEC